MLPDSVIFMGLLIFFYMIYPITQSIDLRRLWREYGLRSILAAEIGAIVYLLVKIVVLLYGV